MAVHKLPRMADVNDKWWGWCFTFKRSIGVACEKPDRTTGLETIMTVAKRSVNRKHLFKSVNNNTMWEALGKCSQSVNEDMWPSYVVQCVWKRCAGFNN